MAGVMGIGAFTWYSPVPQNPLNHSWHGSMAFGMTIALGVFVSMLIAAISGTAAPLVSKRFGFDPSAMGGPMETAFQDVVGSTFLLALSASMLGTFGDHGADCPGEEPQGCMDLCRLDAGNATAALYSTPGIQNCAAL